MLARRAQDRPRQVGHRGTPLWGRRTLPDRSDGPLGPFPALHPGSAVRPYSPSGPAATSDGAFAGQLGRETLPSRTPVSTLALNLSARAPTLLYAHDHQVGQRHAKYVVDRGATQ